MRRSVAAGAVLVLAVAAGVAGFTEPAGAEDPAPSITVTQQPRPGEAGCLPAQEGASATITDTGAEVIVTIDARFPVCGDVTAAVYAMPNNRLFPWPQSKRESETFRITPGVTTVRFAKGCEPQQFDLVTGDTPQTIRPDTGPMHGPLLFTIPWTGIQNWDGCLGATTTTTTTTTTPGATTTTTTTVPGATTTTTTTAVAGATTTTTVPTAVAGVTETRPGGTGGVGSTSGGTNVGAGLATTGTDIGLLSRLAVLLLAVGGTMALAAVLRQHRRPRWVPNL